MSQHKHTKISIIPAIIFTMTVFAELFFCANNTSAATFRPQINIVNSQADIEIDPEADNTGEFIWLDNPIINVNDNHELSFIIDYSLQLFDKLLINGKELTVNEDYILEEGSTIVTLNSNYISQLPSGSYSVAAYYTDDHVFSSSFAVVSETDDSTDPTNPVNPIDPTEQNSSNGTPSDSEESSLSVPNTGMNNAEKSNHGTASFLPKIILILSIISFIILVTRTIINAKKSKQFNDFQKTGLKITSINPLSSKRFLYSTTMLFIISLVVFGLHQFKTSTNDINAVTPPAELEVLPITLSPASTVEEADLSNGTAFLYMSQEVTVNAPTTNGYRLYISMDGENYNELSLNGSISASERITASDATINLPQKLTRNSWGFALDSEAFSTEYTPSIDSSWAGVPVSGGETLIKNVNTATTEGDSTTIYYGFYLSNDLPNGQYWGTDNSKVSIIAVANAPRTFTISYNCSDGNGIIYREKRIVNETTTLNDGSICHLANHRIVAWNTNSENTGNRYELSSQYTGESDITLFAIYEEESEGGEGGEGGEEGGGEGGGEEGGGEEEPSEKYTYSVNFNANGGTNAPETQSVTSSNKYSSIIITSSIPNRPGYTFVKWNTAANESGTSYSPGSTISLSYSSSSITLYAIWTPVKVTSITISGQNTLNFNSTNSITSLPTTKLTASVSPSDALNKSVTWKSSDESVVTIDSSGLVSVVEAGAATITATAKDGSGAKASFKITVNKKIIIIMGASSIDRINSANRANIQTYSTCSSSLNCNYYATRKDLETTDKRRIYSTLKFLYESGTGADDWKTSTSFGWPKAKSIINRYSGRKNYVDFYVYYQMPGNDVANYTCAQIRNSYLASFGKDSSGNYKRASDMTSGIQKGQTNSKYKDMSFKNVSLFNSSSVISYYNDEVGKLKKDGYKINAYLKDLHPQDPYTDSSKVLNSSDPNRCNMGKKTIFKSYVANHFAKVFISQHNLSNISLVETLPEIVETSQFAKVYNKAGKNNYYSVSLNKDTFIGTWKNNYKTTDGVHWTYTPDGGTAKKFFNFLLGLNSDLKP